MELKNNLNRAMHNEVIHVAIVDDDKIIRNALSKYLNAFDDFECDMVCESIDDFMDKTTSKPRLDVILLDIGMPNMNGIQGIQYIKRKYENVSIIMFSVYEDNKKIFDALCAGAVGYLQKSTPMNQIREALEIVFKGGSAMSPAIARKVVEHFVPEKKQHPVLTPKELEVVRGLVDGLSYKLIADRMYISIETVREHIKNIYRKLQVNSKAEVIVKSFKGEI